MKQTKNESKKAGRKTIIKTAAKPTTKPAKVRTNIPKSTRSAPQAAVKTAPKPAPLINNDSIATRAYLLWEKAGRPYGRDIEFWVQAEAQLKQDQALAA